MNQDNELARNLRQTIEFADVQIRKETDELKRAKMMSARDSLAKELEIVLERL